MDALRFDALARAVNLAASRRSAVAALALSLMVPRAGEEAEAKKKKKRKKKCKVNCRGRACGPSNCKGKSCGACPRGERCTQDGRCVCDRACQGKDCGPDGCGGVCGTCTGTSKCTANGQCVGCLSRDDCANGQVCTEEQVCCTRSCDGVHCASDGCGGTCACPGDTICQNDRCVCPEAGQVLCGGACVTAECCSPNNQPGVRCGQVCIDTGACCPNGQGCDQTEQCCGFNRDNPADRAICQDDHCCQPLGGACGGAAVTCCQGICHLGICDTCTPGCGQFEKCCGVVCIPEGECCTNGEAGVCPTNAPHCVDGRCFECETSANCEFRPCRQTRCDGGRCEYPAGHEGNQCLILDSQQDGVCCGGACSQCCGSDTTICPAPPVECLVKTCDGGRCIPKPVSVSGPLGSCALCCTNGDCCDDKPDTICGGSGRCCYESGHHPDRVSDCCSGQTDTLSLCT